MIFRFDIDFFFACFTRYLRYAMPLRAHMPMRLLPLPRRRFA